MATPTGKAQKRIWNPEEAPRYPLRSSEKEAAEEKVEVAADAAIKSFVNSSQSSKEKALSFFWRNANGLERRAPDEARGATKRKWAFLVRSASNSLESELLRNSKHRLWKALRKCDSAPVRKAILEAVFENR